ncbi:hypothetical protein LZ30DRAFT_231434 [Colletotrichum cereale]|nr:hypothetical protein LZ30DRAFT_231434 [Colletotrichum cereale]
MLPTRSVNNGAGPGIYLSRKQKVRSRFLFSTCIYYTDSSLFFFFSTSFLITPPPPPLTHDTTYILYIFPISSSSVPFLISPRTACLEEPFYKGTLGISRSTSSRLRA